MGAPGSKAIEGSFVTFIISFLHLFFFLNPNCLLYGRGWGPLYSPLGSVSASSQVFAVTYFAFGAWVRCHEPQTPLPPRGEEDAP